MMAMSELTVACFMTACLLALALTTRAGQAAGPAVEPPIDPRAASPGLPRVLLIGDSISHGYFPHVRRELEGQAEVHRLAENGGATVRGLEKLDAWLGDVPWAAIHFNFGLHDIKHVDAKGALTNLATGRRLVAVEDYERNLRTLVERLGKVGGKLVFATTTPVPEGATGRRAGDERAINDVARRIMEQAGVPVNDLHAFAAPRLAELQLPHNVHFSDAGYQQLGGQAVAAIRAALRLPAPTPAPAPGP